MNNRVDKRESNVGEKFDKQRRKVIENIEDNYNDMGKNVVVESKITNNNDVVENNENNIIENVISGSTDEFVECDYEMLRCIDEVEREWKNNIVVECGQRVNFPINFSEPECSQMLFFMKGKRPVLVDELKLSLIHILYVIEF